MNKQILDTIPTLPGWTSEKKATFMYDLITKSHAKVVVEIGCFACRMGIALAGAVKETGGHYFGVDPYEAGPSLEGSGNIDNDKYWLDMDFSSIHYEAEQALRTLELNDVSTILKVTSQQAAPNFISVERPGGIDILYVDGNFTEEITIQDIKCYAPIINLGGYVVLNNSDWATKRKGKRLILEYGFVEESVEGDEDKCYWTTYKRTEIKQPEIIKKTTIASPIRQSTIVDKVKTLEGWGTEKQCQTLYNLVVETKAKVTVDIGVFGGRFLYAMALAHKTIGSGVCFGIDPWSVEPCLEGTNDVENADYWKKIDFDGLFRQVTELMIKENLTNHSNILRFKSSEVWPLFTQIDVLSIDGNHSPEISCNDVATWAPLVRPGGYIHFDDANWPTTQDAQELILNYGFEQIMFIEEGNGRDWKIYKKLGQREGANIDVTSIINLSKNEVVTTTLITESITTTSSNTYTDHGIAIEEKAIEKLNEPMVEEKKVYPIYDPSEKEPCAVIPTNPMDIGTTAMQIGPLKVKPILVYLPDTKFWSERWKKGMEHFTERGLTDIIQVPGIHGVQFGVAGVHTYDIDNPGEGYNIGPGYTAQFLSIYMVYNIANILPHEHFMILECDANLVPNFLELLAAELENVPKDFDWLYVGNCCTAGKDKLHIKGNVYEFTPRTSYPFCGHCFIIAKKALPFIIQTQRDCYASSDLSLIFHTFPSLKVYGIVPRLADQFNNNLPL